MCEKCDALKTLVEAADSNPYDNYYPSIASIAEMIEQDKIEIYAGDCPIDEVEKILYEEEHYTLSVYLKCKGCGQYFFIGACIRGKPIYKIINDIQDEEFEKLLWGHYGTFYGNSIKVRVVNFFKRLGRVRCC